MSKVFSAHAVSVDGDTPSRGVAGFRLSEPSAWFLDAVAPRVGAPGVTHLHYEVVR